MSVNAFTRNDPVNPPKPLFDCLEQAIRTAIHSGTNIREVNFTRWARPTKPPQAGSRRCGRGA
jgi:hypothetical protein